MTDNDQIIQAAMRARVDAHAPYSGFSVGAAVMTDDGHIFSGCNVENLSFGLTICAERNAIFSAITAGKRKFTRIAIVADSKSPVTPCGACRQVMAEFCTELEIVSANLAGERFHGKLSELLPRAREGILGT